MSNQVDTSPESVENDWARIVNEHKVDMSEGAVELEKLPPVDSEAVELSSTDQTGLDFEGIDGVDASKAVSLEQPESVTNDPTMEEKIAMAEMVINGGLVFIFDALGGLDIPEDKYARMSRSWAVVIAKRFDGGIFELMAKYKDELAAAGATFVFIGAVRESARIKREENEQKKSEVAGDRQQEKEVNADVHH